MPYPNVDALDWNSLQPHYDALRTEPLNPDNADAWLQRWSDLASVLYEAQVQIQRAITENTADADADRQFQTLVEEILPRARIADQALRDRLLGTRRLHPCTGQTRIVPALRRRSAHLCRG